MGKNKDIKVTEEKKDSFFNKMKNDKKYSAKVQLMGYGTLIVLLVLYLNVSSMNSSGSGGNTIIGDINNSGSEIKNTDKDDTTLLKNVSDNYSYGIVIDIDKKSMNTETEEEIGVEHVIRYTGKSYGNKLEINKVANEQQTLYYKVDDNYYSKVDNVTSFVKDSNVYDAIDKEYIELDNILKLMDKASLDHVTDYSSGKKEYVYHLKVKDVIVSYQLEDVVEINVEEENGILKIKIDYSNLFKVIDNSILEFELEATITEIGEVEDFEVVVNEKE